MGRPYRITYPDSTGINGTYTIEEYYDYGDYSLLDLNNRNVFRVRTYKTCDYGSGAVTVADGQAYYDDHGILLLDRYYDYEDQEFLSKYYDHNHYGQITSAIDILTHETAYEWDEWNRLMSITDDQGNQQKYEYDSFNRTTTSYFTPYTTSINENHYVVTYDQWEQEISRKGFPDGWGQPNVVEEQYQYDLVGNLITLTDPNGTETQFEYDALNRLTKVIDAVGEETNYEYDRLGNLTQLEQYQGYQEYTTSKKYDERGLLLTNVEPEGQTTTYTYNANGLPVQILDPAGKTTAMNYDGNNRLTDITVSTDSINYFYHPLGGVEQYQVEIGGGYGEALTYQYFSTGLPAQRQVSTYPVDFNYDELGNKTQITDPFNLTINYQYDTLNRVDTITVDSKTFDYEYYADGMIKAVDYPNGLRSEYTYDNINRLQTLTNKVGIQVISQFSYEYDQNGNITEVTEDTQTTTYTYDALNRLTGIKRPDGEELKYLYDSRGNRIKGSVTTIDPATFIPGDFAYNNWDELEEFTTGENTYNYEYDPEGLRTKKAGPSTTTRYHCDDNGLVIAESNASDQVTAQNIWGHKPLARKVNGSYYYYVYNGHGDVIQVLNESGSAVNSYEYDEWGNILSCSEQIANPIRYAGEYYDEESGLYYLRARYYDPTIGRFISKDSVEGDVTNPLSLNRYAYCKNDPVGYIDYSGRNPAVAAVYMYITTVASSPDTPIDMQLIALDISQGNYFAATFDAAGLLIPGVTGGGKVADDVAKKARQLFKSVGIRSADEIQIAKETFGNGRVVMPYNILRNIVRGTGLETHHLIEKRFAKTLNINPNDMLSIAIDKETHKQITKLYRNKIGYAYDFKKKIRTTNATSQEIWDATVDIYKELGMEQYLKPLKQQLINEGVNIDFKGGNL